MYLYLRGVCEKTMKHYALQKIDNKRNLTVGVIRADSEQTANHIMGAMCLAYDGSGAFNKEPITTRMFSNQLKKKPNLLTSYGVLLKNLKKPFFNQNVALQGGEYVSM